MVTDLFTTPKCIRKVGRSRGHLKSLKLYLKSYFREQNSTDLLRETNPDSGISVFSQNNELENKRKVYSFPFVYAPVCISMRSPPSGCRISLKKK
ncbi:hypothetical protein TNIN_133671 [Trichonephila inaurata madagascariensis]|uniref:Uncharacterized protein n=1 Tax=Trichonephila inaurata madagascariensis TaxID=2747483 RepID=A0A8X6I9G4_9ARAC|nr:hypothetical protein TNIN_133671 [Trichonephila inaurata madagascariensis]